MWVPGRNDRLRPQVASHLADSQTAPRARCPTLLTGSLLAGGDRSRLHEHRFRGPHQCLAPAGRTPVFSRHARWRFFAAPFRGAVMGSSQVRPSSRIRCACLARDRSAQSIVPDIFVGCQPENTRETGRDVMPFGALVALLDELHQTSLPSRTGSIRDVGIDMVGLTAGVLGIWTIGRRRDRYVER